MKFKSSKTKTLLSLLISLAFIIVGWIFRQQMPMYAGYAAIFVGTLVFCVHGIQLLPGASVLELDDNDFTYTVLFSKTAVLWENVGYFYEVNMQDGKTKKVGWHYSPEVIASIEAQQGTPVDTYMPHGMLPDNYGKKAHEMASILNDFKASKA